tara:strand:- start:225 stop:659 length:435 start_codon:yes stop_codon:yes gene_type:complete
MNKNSLLKYGLNQEVIFLNYLTTKLNNEDIVIKKTVNPYCSVDYIIERCNNSIMIELKSRRVDLKKYDDFFIGYTKLYNISQEYTSNMVLLVWCDIYKNVYFCKYTDELLNSQIKIINGGKCFLINKNETEYGIDKLLDVINAV